MDAPRFDFDEIFDEDYLFFYETLLVDERSDGDAALIASNLGLPAGASILDLACGHGRISNRLAGAGFRVTGLDATKSFLDLARAEAEKDGLDVEYVHGDMRALPWEGRFDAVVNWFTSWGYFGDAENKAVLGEIARALKPGGTLLMDHLNRDFIVRHFQPERVTEHKGAFMIDRSTFDHERSVIETERTIIRDGAERRFWFGVRLPSIPEMRGWLLEAGFAEAGVVEPYSWDGPRVMYRARKAG